MSTHDQAPSSRTGAVPTLLCGTGFSLWTLVLSGCAYVGPPLPPTLDIPQRIIDLSVAEDGDKIRVQFTLPPLTTEGLPLKSVRSVEMRIGPAENPWNESAWAASARPVAIPALTPSRV